MRLFPLFHRTNTASSAKSLSSSTTTTTITTTSTDGSRSKSKTSLLLLNRRPKRANTDGSYESSAGEGTLPSSVSTPMLASECQSQSQSHQLQLQHHPPSTTPAANLDYSPPSKHEKVQLQVNVVEPTPDLESSRDVKEVVIGPEDDTRLVEADLKPHRPDAAPRRQSLANPNETRFLKTLLGPDIPPTQGGGTTDYFGGLSANMLHRKIWVKRPGASATLVVINEDDLVDDVRDMILKKYANSLGRCFDSPDVTLRIVPRDLSHRNPQAERTLGPEEPITRTLDAYYPGGQSVDEALLIDVPPRRTPKHSPKVQIPYYIAEDIRPGEGGTDYFPPMPMGGIPSPHLPSSLSVASGQSASHHPSVHSISVLSTGQVPPLPSPGGRSRHGHRPKYGRTHTSSPTMVQNISMNPNDRGPHHLNGPPVAPPIPTPPLNTDGTAAHRAATPPPRVSSPRPVKANGKRGNKSKPTNPTLPRGLLDGAVPPISVLIVEDNIINLKLLEAFMKRLKVRWHTAMNGREAVNKWKEGGFHLVLMDIQLPIMNGLEATKEIRRLERVNGVGFVSSPENGSEKPNSATGEEAGKDEVRSNGPEDILTNTELFKSPVIIVALTASSLQSDRHEALAAGCNDFLTKPVNFVWLERKVMEWGCMQALIDFDGWRKWKDFSQASSNSKPSLSQASAANNSNNNNSTTTNSSSGSMPKESPKDGAKNKKAVAMNGGPVSLPRTGSGLSIGKREKRRSLGSGNLSGVLEDGNEDEHGGAEKAPTGSSIGGGKVIAAGA